MMMSAAAGAMRAVRIIHAVVQELRRKTVGADLQGECMARCRHEAHRHERASRECEQQDAGNQFAAHAM
jgi:hypothetical protein